MKNKRNLIIFILIIAAVCVIGITIVRKNFVKAAKNMGSFTFDRIGSYDEKYYAISDKTEKDNIEVSIYETENDEWKLNENVERPNDIISKYD